MKFQRTDLIKRTKAAIAAKKKYAADKTAEVAQQHKQSQAEYVAKTEDDWYAFAETIISRVRVKEPVRTGDIPQGLRTGWRGGIDTWGGLHVSEYRADTAALEQLLALLNAATDDEITTSSLERMGFRLATLFPSR